MSYVYRLDHPVTGEFYIGYRKANVNKGIPSHLDFPEYKTSAPKVKARFDEFNWHIVAEFFHHKDALAFEQQLIYESWAIPGRLNKRCNVKRVLFDTSGKNWITNGIDELLIDKSEMPEGWIIGRSSSSRQKASDSSSCKAWFNDGVSQTRQYVCPEGFVEGVLSKTKVKMTARLICCSFYNNGKKEVFCKESEKPAGYDSGRLRSSIDNRIKTMKGYKFFTDGTDETLCLPGNQPEGWILGKSLRHRKNNGASGKLYDFYICRPTSTIIELVDQDLCESIGVRFKWIESNAGRFVRYDGTRVNSISRFHEWFLIKVRVKVTCLDGRLSVSTND